jgi:hypothetical protein
MLWASVGFLLYCGRRASDARGVPRRMPRVPTTLTRRRIDVPSAPGRMTLGKFPVRIEIRMTVRRRRIAYVPDRQWQTFIPVTRWDRDALNMPLRHVPLPRDTRCGAGVLFQRSRVEIMRMPFGRNRIAAFAATIAVLSVGLCPNPVRAGDLGGFYAPPSPLASLLSIQELCHLLEVGRSSALPSVRRAWATNALRHTNSPPRRSMKPPALPHC